VRITDRVIPDRLPHVKAKAKKHVARAQRGQHAFSSAIADR
jgi:hypothetical protein